MSKDPHVTYKILTDKLGGPKYEILQDNARGQSIALKKPKHHCPTTHPHTEEHSSLPYFLVRRAFFKMGTKKLKMVTI